MDDGAANEILASVPILKATDEEQIVTGVVLVPGVLDAQKDVVSAEEIRRAAHDFMIRYVTETEIGFMHKAFSQPLRVVESWIAPTDVEINGVVVPAGSWVMSVKVLDAKIWAAVKKGEIRGFSIGGKGKRRPIPEVKAA